MKKLVLNSEIATILGIIILATAVRLVALFNFGTFTFDDLFSVHFAGLELTKMFSFLQNEVHPPFYYILLHYWIKIFGNGEIIVRLLSIILNVAAIPLLYIIAKKMLNRWVATFASLIFALSYFQVFTAITVRMYSLLNFLGLLALLLFWLIFVDKKTDQKKYLWLAYTAVNTLLLFTHLGGIFGLLTQWLWYLILLIKKQIGYGDNRKFLISQFCAIGLFLLWLIPLFLPKLKEIISVGWYFDKSANHSAAIGLYDYFFLLLKNYWLRFVSGVIIFTAPFIVLIYADKKMAQNLPGKINPNWFLFAWFLPAYFASCLTKITLTRIFLISYTGFILIIAYFFYVTLKNNKKIFYLMAAAWLLISIFNLQQNLTANLIRWDLADSWLNQNLDRKSKIIIFPFYEELTFRHYYTGTNDFSALYPPKDGKTLEQRVAENNWKNIIDKNNISELEFITNGFTKIALINTLTENYRYFETLPHQWFTENGWQAIQLYRPQALFGPSIIIYQKK